MTTKDIVRQLSQKMKISREDAELFLDCLIGIWKRALSIGDEVKLDRFGKLVSNLNRRKVLRSTGEEISETGIEVGFVSYPFLKKELIDMSVISAHLLKEVEYVVEEDTDGRQTQ